MRSITARAFGGILFSGIWLTVPSSPALAQSPGASPSASPDAQVPDAEEQPPQLIEQAAAVYPEQAKAERREVTVGLRLSVDASGNVTDVEVTEPAGHGFDEAAREAALRFRFEPAQLGGQPVAASVLFRYEFRLPTTEPPAPEPGAIPGSVSMGGAPVSGAEISVSGPEGAAQAGGAAQPVPPALTKQPIEVTVKGTGTEGQRLQESAEAVNVVDLRKAKEQTADLGEVLARTQDVAVRRNGGLGSSTRFSLNGLYDEHVRFYIDGVPLDMSSSPSGVANVPVNLIDRVEIYRGVVPIRLGADALGGALNLVTDQRYESHLGASYQVGSFGTHRITANGRHRHEPTGLVLGAAAFFDNARNDYPIDVKLTDDEGQRYPATVKRFHDSYRAYGGNVEAGVVDRPWARRLLLSGFYSTYDKDLQHNIIMSLPYGEVTYGETVYGATGRYQVEPTPSFEVEIVGSYAHRIIDFSDRSKWIYDWRGERIGENPGYGGLGGEIAERPSDATIWEDRVFGRGFMQWTIAPEHILRASVSPSFSARTGDERLQAVQSAPDPLAAERELFTFVSGLEYELNLLNDRFSNVLFVKDYYYLAKAENRPQAATSHTQGVGDSLRFRFTPWMYAKASYEYATRLPRPDEAFGNGILIEANYELKPEVSHNVNLGPRIEIRRTSYGDFTIDLSAFFRETERLIFLLGNERRSKYQNVYDARGWGLGNTVNWVSPGRYVSLDGMISYQEVRNASSDGLFGAFEGDRIPNRPYLFGSWGARFRFAGMPGARDTIEPFYNGRYVHEFFRGWESRGLDLSGFKPTVDSQVTHNVGLSWIVSREVARVTTTLEVDNVADAKVYDNFGVQRPGRAFYAKLTGEI